MCGEERAGISKEGSSERSSSSGDSLLTSFLILSISSSGKAGSSESEERSGNSGKGSSLEEKDSFFLD